MKKITFIVGNGLDISLGMQTSYPEFYDYITKKRKAANSDSKLNNSIYDAIQKDYEDWSDFEEALGRHTEGVETAYGQKEKQAFIEEFFESYNEVLEDLAEYLAVKEDEFTSKSLSYFIKSTDMYAGLKDGAARKITQIIESHVLEMNFVSLNYTDVLEKLLYIHAQALKQRGIDIKPVHHAHGSLSEYLTIGVNDESQLSAAFEDEHKDNLIKNKLLASMDDDRLTTTQELIANSSVIVLFGVSLGETDGYLWRQVIRWLRTNRGGYVILHDYNDDYVDSRPRNPIRIKQLDSQARDRLLKHAAELDGDELVELRSRILVIRNTERLFKL
jgi:hypothetical protein